MKNGLVSVSFRDKSPEEITEAASAAGLSGIEWGSDVHARPADRRTLQHIRQLCTEKKLRISSYGTYYRIGVHSEGELMPYVQAAKLLGTDTLRLWCGGKGFGAFSAAEKQSMISACCRLAEIAAAQDVVLCLECHNHTFTDEAEGALLLMQTVNSACFRMYWQPNQFKTPAENLRYAAAIAPYCPVVHVFNWAGAERFPLSAAIPLWKQYLSPFGPDTWCLLEFMPDDRIASLPAEAAALAKITEG